jgi:hypothetical protein
MLLSLSHSLRDFFLTTTAAAQHPHHCARNRGAFALHCLALQSAIASALSSAGARASQPDPSPHPSMERPARCQPMLPLLDDQS